MNREEKEEEEEILPYCRNPDCMYCSSHGDDVELPGDDEKESGSYKGKA